MSKSKLKDATYSVYQLVKSAPVHSEKTKADTLSILKRAMSQLHGLGYKLSHIQGLKEKHVISLVAHWKASALKAATIKNYISKLRWACRMMGKPHLIAKTNDSYAIAKRSYIPKSSKAIQTININGIRDAWLKLSIQAQQLFGLRREESLKLIVSEADQGDYLVLKGSWTKGGVPRKVPIITNEQRAFLNKLHQVVPKGASLIPKHLTHKQQMNRYISEIRCAGLKNLHGLRHAYAQNRYRYLTDQLTQGKGWDCPFKGGKPRHKLNRYEKEIDHRARLFISNELGHGRAALVKIYCG
ncbi:MAG: integrase [Gammaproteobacteria bacterium]|nr:integrase [Gammaproteobacteria bacterium]